MTALVERHGNTAPGAHGAPGTPGTPGAARLTRFTAMVVVSSPFVRETLSRSLRTLGAGDIVEASSMAEARTRAVGSRARDFAIIDSTLPDGSGIALVRELRAVGWVRGMVLSATEDPYTVRAALTGGVRAFLVTSASAGHAARAATPQTLAVRPRTTRLSGAESLSGREIEVLQHVADGRSNKDIGEALGLSALTVKSHLARIARKLGTGDRAEMVVVSMRAGVVA